jgi:iron complex outermembrane recepter protein
VAAGAWQLNQGVKIYGGVNNLFNARPAFDQTSYPNGWEGRVFYAGAALDVQAMR